jgi:hypothetical protein
MGSRGRGLKPEVDLRLDAALKRRSSTSESTQRRFSTDEPGDYAAVLRTATWSETRSHNQTHTRSHTTSSQPRAAIIALRNPSFLVGCLPDYMCTNIDAMLINP